MDGLYNWSNKRFICWLTYWLNDWLCDWLLASLIDWLIKWLIDWLCDWLLASLIDLLIEWLIAWLIDCVIDCLLHWLTDWMNNWSIDWLLGWLIDWNSTCLECKFNGQTTSLFSSSRTSSAVIDRIRINIQEKHALVLVVTFSTCIVKQSSCSIQTNFNNHNKFVYNHSYNSMVISIPKSDITTG